MNSIQQLILGVIPPKHKNAAKGWLAFNAPCCTHNGETPDKRSRGGLLMTPEGGASYHCFNCGFKASWRPGMHFGYKMRRLVSWMGMDEGQIQRIVFDAMRQLDTEIVQQEREKVKISFEPRELPANASIAAWLENGMDDEDLTAVISYITSRGFELDSWDWRWSHEDGYRRRVLIPYTWQGQEIGYTARSIDLGKGKTKYIQHVGSDYVFGMDQQRKNAKFALLLEGPFDAIAVGGLAALTNEVSERKAEIIDTLGKEVIVVPDMDKSGGKLIDAALAYGWSVSFPEWQPDIKDAADAMQRYGQLFTLRSILHAKQDSKLKIELMRKRHGI